MWLDHRVAQAFEGKRWSLPALIYARPLELYAGRALDADDLEAELRLAGYHRARSLGRAGTYRRDGDRFRIRARRFRFWDAEEPEREVAVQMRAGAVAAVASGTDAAPLARIDPALVGRIFPRHGEDRILHRLGDVPPLLPAALVTIEDRGFFRHHGVSPRAILRAAWANLRAGATVQGGSTITQQLAKNFFLGAERTLWRKLTEAAIALLLERRYSKEEILEAYMNEVHLGQHGRRAVHGFGMAARYWFDRPLPELDTQEIALLVALVRGASYYDPRRHPERALERRNLVLDVLAEHGVLPAARARAAQRAPLGVTARPGAASSRYPAFVDLVRRQLRRDYRDADLRSEGLRIFTTLDPSVQEAGQRALQARLDGIERSRPGQRGLQGAMVVAAPVNGEVLAVVGSREPGAVGFNRALDALRPIGSLVKPAVYLAALQDRRGYTLATPIEDGPVAIRADGGTTWRPHNYDGRSHGTVPLYRALADSYNLATVRLGMEVGLPAVRASLRRLGAARPVPEYPAILLGAVEMTPLEVAQVYQPLAGGGFRVPLRAIREVTGADGAPLARYGLEVEPAADGEAVYLVRAALREVMRSGTGRSAGARLPAALDAAGKTGTTDDLRDSWFAGFAGDRLAVVWVGRDDNAPAGLTGAGGALRVWTDLMARLRPGAGVAAEPPGIVWRWVGPDGAGVGGPGCPGSVRLPFASGTAPPPGGCAPARARAPMSERSGDG